MKIIACTVAIAPLRKEASHRSEMVSQLLLNETAELLEEEKQFTRVRCLHDDYEGWIANNQLKAVDAAPASNHTTEDFTTENVRAAALRYLETPYLWGGRTRCGIDCSGFSQAVYQSMGIALPRDAWQQAEQGEVVGFLQEAVCGDLAFFDNEEGRITHVGVMLNAAEVIHASGKVRIDPIDNQGIINGDTGVRTHRLRVIKRYKKP